MYKLERRFNIARRGILKTHLGVEYQWGVRDDSKAFCKATMEKKVKATVEQYEAHVMGEAKI